MIPSKTKHPHSADVAINLILADRTLKVRELGPDFIVLDRPADLPPTTGEIELVIDGSPSRWSVRLPDGVSGKNRETRTAPMQDAVVAQPVTA